MNDRINELLKKEPGLGVARRSSLLVAASGPYQPGVQRKLNKIPVAQPRPCGGHLVVLHRDDGGPAAGDRAGRRPVPGREAGHTRAGRRPPQDAARPATPRPSRRRSSPSARSPTARAPGRCMEAGRVLTSQVAIGAAAGAIVTGSDAVLGPLARRKDKKSPGDDRRGRRDHGGEPPAAPEVRVRPHPADHADARTRTWADVAPVRLLRQRWRNARALHIVESCTDSPGGPHARRDRRHDDPAPGRRARPERAVPPGPDRHHRPPRLRGRGLPGAPRLRRGGQGRPRPVRAHGPDGRGRVRGRRAAGHRLAPAPRLRDLHLPDGRHVHPPGLPRRRRRDRERRHPVHDRRRRGSCTSRPRRSRW